MCTNNATVVSCAGSGCGSSYNYGTVIKLTPKASAGFILAGWGRDCAGQGSTCTLTMDMTHRVTAAFNLAEPPDREPGRDADQGWVFERDAGGGPIDCPRISGRAGPWSHGRFERVGLRPVGHAGIIGLA